MFGSISKKEYDMAVHDAYRRGYNAAKNDVEMLVSNNEVLFKALHLIAYDKDENDAEITIKSARNIAETAIHWHKLNTPIAYRMTEEEPVNKPEDTSDDKSS